MIDLNKKYTTKGGNPVVLYDIVEKSVFGRYKSCVTGQWVSCEWSLQYGKHYAYTGVDLVEVPEFSIISHNIKKVKYFDIELTVPTWVRWIAVSCTGEIQLFDDVPDISSTQWIKNNSLGKFTYLPFNVWYTGDWKKSLREV